MSRENLYRGCSGEHYVRSLLNDAGFGSSSVKPDIGTDLVAMSPKWQNKLFQFQVKFNSKSSSGVTVRAEFLRKSFSQPTFVVLVEGRWPTRNTYIASGFDWILKHPNKVASSSVHFFMSQSSFTRIQDPKQLSEFLDYEAGRIEGSNGSMFSPAEHNRPCLDQIEFYRSFGSIANAEAPCPILEDVGTHSSNLSYFALHTELAKLRQSALLLRAVPDRFSGPTANWVRIMNNLCSSGSYTEELREFKRFVAAARAFQKDPSCCFDFPDFRWRPTAVWRVFTSIYPNTFRLVEAVLADPSRWSESEEHVPNKWTYYQVCVAIGIAAAQAFSLNESVCARARGLLHLLDRNKMIPANYETLPRYALAFQCLNSLAQIDPKYSERIIELITQDGMTEGRDFALHRRYYRASSEAVYLLVSKQKLDLPLPWDLLHRPVSTVQLECVMKHGDYG